MSTYLFAYIYGVYDIPERYLGGEGVAMVNNGLPLCQSVYIQG